jgi:simple sugar transport system permease protein
MIYFGVLATSTIRKSIPYACGALGGTLSERGGVVNIGLEGLMLTGAFTYVTTVWWIEQQVGPVGGVTATLLIPTAGVVAALAAGFLVSLVHAAATVTFKVNHIISGLAINIFALGATNFLLKRIFNSSSNSERCLSFENWQVFSPDGTFAVANQLFHPLILLTILMFVAAHLLVYRTRFGLRLRSVGENPAAADSLGVSVTFYRYWGVLLGGMAAGVGGVWLASDVAQFTSGMTAGRGYTALAAMIVGKWRPGGAAIACLIFGFAEGLGDQLEIYKQEVLNLPPETLGWFATFARNLPTQVIKAIPYLLTIIVVAGAFGRSVPPAADGIPYEKETE